VTHDCVFDSSSNFITHVEFVQITVG
jgi:hypothetical protein